MIKVLSLWYSRVVPRFFKDNEKKLFKNLERSTLKFERMKSHIIFNETSYNNNILSNYTRKINWQITEQNTARQINDKIVELYRYDKQEGRCVTNDYN